MARANLSSHGCSPSIIHADLFDLSDKDVDQIKNFSPKGIACWFVGLHPDDVDKHTQSTLAINERPNKYRENIEDLLLTENICLQTVEWIHLANRVGVIESASEDEIIEATKVDYNTYLFSEKGFEVDSVKIINWEREGSRFLYANAHNPNLMPGKIIPSIISILAKRVEKA